MTASAKTYIGDSVHAEVSASSTILLTTNNGYGPTNSIYLGPDEIGTLVRWLESLGWKVQVKS